MSGRTLADNLSAAVEFDDADNEMAHIVMHVGWMHSRLTLNAREAIITQFILNTGAASLPTGSLT